MPPPNKSSRAGRIADSDESEMPSNNLWVGNLASDVTDSDLMDLFVQYGALDSVTSYSSRSYAFVFFKRIEDAKAAKEALQGAELRGHPVKIEFARPVCSDLCVSLGLFSFRFFLVYGFVSLCNIIHSNFAISAVLWVSTFNLLSSFSDP
jgi:RNA recognition motif-containing protein